MKTEKRVSLIVNGETHELEVGDRRFQAALWDTLAHTLRETLGLTGTKVGCDHGACGYCTPGMILGARALLDRNPCPDESEVKGALSGHYCRCISHYHVVRAVMDAAKKET